LTPQTVPHIHSSPVIVIIIVIVILAPDSTNVDLWVWVAQACNPSYSGGRDQEDHELKPPEANSL
jgi:hypothetical protein